ncbi:MAG: hypothetical protein VYE22_32505 [Myxococcota bacterium]|nr:hypothetical protein [Myxococcota bacterium]
MRAFALVTILSLVSSLASAQAVDDDAPLETETADVAPTPVSGDARAIAWALFAGAVALTVGGAITLAAGVDDVNTIENAADGSTWASVEDAYARGPVLTGIGAAILGLGVASLGVSAALLAHFGADGTWIEARIGPGSLTLRGVF